MTKEELLEDVQVGDVVKIYTESAETFKGTVTNLGESGLKITLLNSNKAKRIMYGRITEYDIEDDEDIASANTATIVDISKNDVESDVAENNEETDYKEVVAEKIEAKTSIQFDRNRIFDVVEAGFDLDVIREEWVSGLESEQKRKYNRIADILNYAKKVNEYKLDGDRVKRVIAEYKKLTSDITAMNVFIALIYHEFNDVNTAVEYYHKGGAYDIEFQLSLVYGYGDLFEKAILAVEYNKENELVVKWLCEYAVKNNDFAVLSHVINHCEIYLKKALLYWYIDKPEFQMVPDKEDLSSNANIIYLKNLNTMNAGKNDTHIKTILSNVVRSEDEKSTAVIEKKDAVYKGIISYYNKNGGNGVIKNSDGGSIYFYIKQVKDLDLQRILATEANYKRKVTYTRGINFKGEIAADSIELDGVEDVVIIEPEYEYEGFFEDYDIYKNMGKIRSGNKVFNFFFDAVKDPLLYAEILSRPYSVLDLTIKFNARDYKSKKTKKSSKIAYDICGVKEYSQQQIDDFISQRYVTRKEVDEWLGVAPEKNTGYFRATEYEPLEGTIIGNEDRREVKKTSGISVAERKESCSEYSLKEKEAVDILLATAGENPFSKLKKDNSGRKYFQEAHRYMTGVKDISGRIVGIDLEKAEIYFIKAIEACEQVNSAVANLSNNVYIQLGGDYVVKGLQLLEVYGCMFPEDKLTDMRIQLIDKSGNLEALELIYQSAIPRVNKKSKALHYMSKLAGVYFKRKEWDEAVQWFNKSIRFIDKNKKEFSQYFILRKGIMRSLIISNYNAGNESIANEQAHKYIELAPEDIVIKSIIEGVYKVNDNAEVIEEFSELIEENIGLTHINLFVKNRIEEMNLDSEIKVKNLLEDGIFMGTQPKAASILDAILDPKNRSVNEEAKSNQYLAGAKLIRQILDRDEEIDTDKFNEQRFLFFVAEGTCSYANSRLYRKELIDNLDVARYFYMQPITVFDDSDKFRASWAVATIRFIQTYFESIDDIRQDGSFIYQRIKDFASCDETLQELLKKTLLSDVQEFMLGMIELLTYNSRIKKNVLKCLYQGQYNKEIIERLNKILIGDGIVPKTLGDFETLWNKASSKYFSKRKQILKLIDETIDSLFVVGQLQANLDKYQEEYSLLSFNKTDTEYFGDLLSIFKHISKYNEISEFDYKAVKLKSADDDCKNLVEKISDYPTYVSYEKLINLLERIREQVLVESGVLYKNSEPQLSVSLSGDSSVEEDARIVRVPIAFTNKSNVQDADNVQISIAGEGVENINDSQLSKGILRGDGRAKEELVTFRITEGVLRSQEFSVEIVVNYQYHTSMSETQETTAKFVLSVPLYSGSKFDEIDNKFEDYKNGSEVKDETMFYGRDRDIENIISQISGDDGRILQGRCLALYGQTRTGKSSLLYHLEKRLRSINPIGNIVVNIGSIGEQGLTNDDITDFLYAILDGIQYEIKSNHQELKEKLNDLDVIINADRLLEDREHSQSFFNKSMTDLCRALEIQTEQYSIILMIDEFTYIYDWIRQGSMTDRIMQFWKGFIQKHGIFAIIIGQDHMKRFVEEDPQYTNAFGSTNLKKITYLSEDDAKKLMYEPIMMLDENKEFVSRYNEDALDRLYELTSGSAYLIMIVCAGLVDYLNTIHSGHITKAHIDDYLRKNLVSFDERFFEPQYDDKSEVEADKKLNAVNQNKKILLRIAQLSNKKEWTPLQSVVQTEQDKKTIESLQLRDVVIVENNDRCKIKVSLYKEWLLQKYGLEVVYE